MCRYQFSNRVSNLKNLIRLYLKVGRGHNSIIHVYGKRAGNKKNCQIDSKIKLIKAIPYIFEDIGSK